MSKPIGLSLAGVAFVLCWSSGFVGAKLGTGDAPVLTVLMWRFLPASALLGLALALRGRPHLTPRSAGRHVAVGLLSQTTYLLTVYGAIGLGVSTGTTALGTFSLQNGNPPKPVPLYPSHSLLAYRT